MKKSFGLILSLLFLFALPGIALAQPLDVYITGSGGGQVNSSNYSLDSTVGQAVIGTADGTGYKLGAGYWYAVTEVTSESLPPVVSDPPPAIQSFEPPSPVNDFASASRTFNITVNQTVNIIWLINSLVVQTNTSVTTASYTNMGESLGTWNVSAIAQNANGTAMQIWTWNVVTTQPTANSLGVNNASGNQNTFVLVPVNITNLQSETLGSIIFDIAFNSSIINLTSTRVTRGDLTSSWDSPSYNPANHRISIIAGSSEISIGSTGSVIILNFSVIGAPDSKSEMNISRIQLAGGSDPYTLGTAPSKNGTFTVATTILPTLRFINGTVMDSVNKTGISGVTVSINTNRSTTTNASGFYSFEVASGEYNLTAKFEPTYYMNNTLAVSTIGEAVVLQDIELVKKLVGNVTGSVTS